VTIAPVSGARAMQLPAFTYQCSRHEIRPFLSLESLFFSPFAVRSGTGESAKLSWLNR